MVALGWALRRLAFGAVGVVVALTIVFLGAQRLTDPVTARLGPDAPHSQVVALRHELGLDRPLAVQAADTASNIVRGRFGDSYQFSRPAGQIVGPAVVATLALTIRALPLSLAVALLLGVGLTLVELKIGHRFAGTPLLILASVPTFVAAVLVVQILAVQLGLAPPSGTGARPLAALVLGAASGVQLALLLGDRLHELAREPYVLAALTRGLRPGAVVRRHLLRPAGVQLSSFAALEAGYLLGGALVIETVFAYPGIGRLAVGAAEFRDLPILLSAASVSAAAFLLVRLVGDLALVALDPRIRDGLFT